MNVSRIIDIDTPDRVQPDRSQTKSAVWQRLTTRTRLKPLLDSVRTDPHNYGEQQKLRKQYLKDVKDEETKFDKGFGRRALIVNLNRAIDDPTKENLAKFYNNVLEIYDKRKKEDDFYEAANAMKRGSLAAAPQKRSYADVAASPRKAAAGAGAGAGAQVAAPAPAPVQKPPSPVATLPPAAPALDVLAQAAAAPAAAPAPPPAPSPLPAVPVAPAAPDAPVAAPAAAPDPPAPALDVLAQAAGTAAAPIPAAPA